MIPSRPYLGISACVALAVATSAYAQQTNTQKTELEEVIVTAEKRETSLQDTAISIQVTEGETLRQEGKRRIDEIMEGIVGVQSQSAEIGTSFYMRGVGFDRGQQGPPGGAGPTQEAVAVIVDGVYQARSETVRGGTLDVSQVEVMRGPQSTTLGGSSLAGAVSLVSNKPVFDEFSGRVLIESGNFDKLSTEGVINLPISSDQALRLAVATDRRDGYYASGIGNSDLNNAKLKYRWQPSDVLDIVLAASKQDILGTGVTLGALSYQGFYTPWTTCTQSGEPTGIYDCSDTTGANAGVLRRGNPPTYGHVDSDVTYEDRSDPWDDGMPANNWGHDVFNDTSITAYNANIDWDLDFATLSVVPSYESGTRKSAEIGGSGLFVSEHVEYESYQVDAHLNSASTSPFEWLVGVNYYYFDQPSQFQFTLYPGNGGPGGFCPPTASTNCNAWATTYEQSHEEISFYGNTTFEITDELRLIAGLRYTDDTKAAQAAAGGEAMGTTEGPYVDPTPGTRYEGSWDDVTYRIGAQYDLTDSAMLYATYSTGYQPGNFAVGMDGSVRTGPEQTLDQITLGIKSRLLENTLQLNVELFDSQYENRGQQAGISYGDTTLCIAPPGPPQPLLVASDYSCLVVSANTLVVPDLVSRGVDIEISWLPTDADRVDFSLEYLQSEQSAPVETSGSPITLADIIAAAGTAPAGSEAADLLAYYNSSKAAYDGVTLQNSPEWSGNVTYQHDFLFASGSTLTPKVNLAYKSEYWTAIQGLAGGLTPENPGPAGQDAYVIYNAYLVWQDAESRYTVTGYVKNIEDKPILQDYSSANGFRGAASVSLGAPRTYGVIFEASF